MQILEVVGKGSDLVLCHELLKGDLVSGLLTDRINIVGSHGVLALVLSHLCVDFRICRGVCQNSDVADAPVLDLPAVLDLAFQTVAVGNRDITHVVAEGGNAGVFGNADGLGDLGELTDLLDYFVMLIIACHDLVRDAQLGKDEAVLTVTVGCLVEVHEVHVDLIIGKLLICLCVQVQEGLSQLLQALDPHLGRGEGMHPCDDAYAVIIVADDPHILDADLRCLNSGKEFDLNGIADLLIQEIDHFFAVCGDLFQTLFSVKILAAGNKV